MPRINWIRVIAGGLVAALICFVSDGLLHEKLVGADWQAVYNKLGSAQPQPHSLGLVYFAIFELGRGLVSMFLYAHMRSHCGPGPRTAVFAGVVAWLAFSIAGPAQFIPLGFFSNTLWLKAGTFQLISSVLATIAGAALYKEPVRPVETQAR